MAQSKKMPDTKSALQSDLERISRQLMMLQGQLRDVQTQLYVIQKAKTFKLWQYYCSLRNRCLRKVKKVAHAAKQHLPLWLRKRIKAKFQRLSAEPHTLAIDQKIQKEWLDWDKDRLDGSFDVLIFGITNFGFRYQRPQHLAAQFHHFGHRVFYIETEFLPLKEKVGKFAPFKIERYTDNFYIVTLSSYNNLFIYHDTMSEKDREIMMASIRLLIKETGIVNPVAKLDHPFWGTLRQNLAMPIIYDCMDEHGGFKHTSQAIENNEKALFTESDLVIASSDYLYDKISKAKPKRLIHVKNAGDYSHFHHARYRNFKQPNDIAHLPRPIIGYYGAIADWFDHTIIRQLAKDFPKVSVVLIGNVDNEKIKQLADQFPNIHLLGEKAYQVLPHYLQEFDVCLIPFITNNLIKATSPVKAYEYLASGKPIVATMIPELQPYKAVVYMADTPKKFSNQVKLALKENSQEKISIRQKISQENTWQMRGQVICDAMITDFFPKVSVIVLAYFKAEYTKRCLDSILERSKYPNLELIIVNNPSDAATLQVVKSYRNDPRVKIIYNKVNVGFGKGNNIGFKQATGDYFIVFNNDTVVTPGWISRLVFHNRKKGVGLVGPVTNGIGNEAKINLSYDEDMLSDMEHAARHYTAAHWGETLTLPNLAAFCWILPASLYKKIGGFDERYGKAYFEDDDYCMMVKKANLTLLCAEDVFIHHYWGSSHRSPDQFMIMENRKIFEAKWHVTWQPHKSRKQ